MEKQAINMMHDKVFTQIEEIAKEAWKLVKKLNTESYPSQWEQFKDMERVGQMARAMRKLMEGVHALRYAEGEYSSEE